MQTCPVLNKIKIIFNSVKFSSWYCKIFRGLTFFWTQCIYARQSPLGQLRQPRYFLSAPLFSVTLLSFYLPPVASVLVPVPSLRPRNTAIGSPGSTISSTSRVRGGAAKAFPVYFEPRNLVWWPLFCFFCDEE